MIAQRRISHGRLGIILAGVILCAAAAVAAAAGAAGVEEKKKSSKPMPDDTWLAKVFMVKLAEAGKAWQFDKLAREVEEAILARVCCEQRIGKLGTLNDLVYVMRACKYLPEAREAGGKDLADFLLENHKVARRLYRAFVLAPRKEYAYKWLAKLVAIVPKRVGAYPDLSVAFATSHPHQNYRSTPRPASRLDSFRWFTNPKRSFRYDLREVPFELSQYIADTRISIPERKWAYDKYQRYLNPAKSFFHVPYDTAAYKRGVPKKIDSHAYTLPNIDRYGGVCIDQAYFSVEVCKAMGMPSTIDTGVGVSGMSHAWNACFKIARASKRTYWDCTTGRYKEHRYYAGDTWYPIIGSGMHDNELMLIGQAARLSVTRREGADSLLEAAKLAEKACDEKIASVDLLKDLAKFYNTKLKLPGDRKIADPNKIEIARQIDPALVKDLLAASIAANLAYMPAWDYLLKLRRNDFIAPGDLNRFLDYLLSRTAKTYPQYGYEIFIELADTIEDDSLRRGAFRKAGKAFGHRPDLRGRLLIALGDDYLEKSDNKAKALAAYELAATECVNHATIVVPAAAKAEKLLMGAKRIDLAIGMYRKLFNKAKKVNAYDQRSSGRASLGRRLAQLLTMSGDKQGAAAIIRKISR